MVSRQTLAATLPFEAIMTMAHLENIKDTLLCHLFIYFLSFFFLRVFHSTRSFAVVL